MNLLSIIWCITSIILVVSSFIFSKKYCYVQFNYKKIFESLKTKRDNAYSPISCLNLSLSSKVGVGSISGVALSLYYGGVQSLFWLVIFSIFLSINTYVECVRGSTSKMKIANMELGGPITYIKNKKWGIIYTIGIIITYSILLLSIQSTTIISVLQTYNLDKLIVAIILTIITFLIIKKGNLLIIKITNLLVPLIFLVYIFLLIYLIINMKNLSISFCISELFNIKSIIPSIVIGIQRAIFITESGLGTSAFAASLTNTDKEKQALIQVMGIYFITIFICIITSLLIETTNYREILVNPTGIEIVIYAFTYHFSKYGKLFLTIITILFAYSTIISAYFFGKNNLLFLTRNKFISNMFLIVITCIIFISSFIKMKLLWDMTDFFIAGLVIINIVSLLKIDKYKK